MVHQAAVQNLLAMDAGKSTLFQAWVQGCTSPTRKKALQMITMHVVRELLDMPEAEAQALQKDPQVPSLHYKLCSIWQSCSFCCCSTSKGDPASQIRLVRNPVLTHQV